MWKEVVEEGVEEIVERYLVYQSREAGVEPEKEVE